MHILVLRFSSMGDVAITVPVFKEVLAQHKDLHITMVSRPAFAPFFADIPKVEFIGADFEKDYKGTQGLYKLYKKIQQLKPFDAVLDLHNVLRTQALCGLFKLSKNKVYKLDKGRTEKKSLIRYPKQQIMQLKTTAERYADVFRAASINVQLSQTLHPEAQPMDDHLRLLAGDKSSAWVGIAPFAQHEGKMYPHDKMQTVMHTLLQQNVKVFLFGGAGEEAISLNKWLKGDANVTVVAGKLDLAQELVLMSHLDAMISMDSANAHMASIKGVPVVSVWGATHPYAGFMAYGQSQDNAIQVKMDCRPCSVYGDKPCFKPQLGCMLSIKPEQISNKVMQVLGEKT